MKKKGWFIRLRDFLFTMAGDISYEGKEHPAWIMYKPVGYKLKGKDLWEGMEYFWKGKAQIGDILLRRFDRYLDSYFIPGVWKHAGVYVGFDEEVGGPTVIHALSEGIIKEHVSLFMRTDYLCIMRPVKIEEEVRKEIIKEAYKQLEKPYDFSFTYSDHSEFYCTELIGYLYEKYVKFSYIEKGLWPFVPRQKQLVADNIFLSSDLELVWYSQNAFHKFHHIFMQKARKR